MKSKLYAHIISGDVQTQEDWEADIKNDIQTNWSKELCHGVWLYSKPGHEEDEQYIPRPLDIACAMEFEESLEVQEIEK